MAKLSILLMALAVGACSNPRYPGERDPQPQAAVGSGGGEPVVSGADNGTSVTSGCDRRTQADCR